jgi:hypothetical protein
MSTKIFNGYKYNGNLTSLMNDINDYREVFFEKVYLYFCNDYNREELLEILKDNNIKNNFDILKINIKNIAEENKREWIITLIKAIEKIALIYKSRIYFTMKDLDYFNSSIVVHSYNNELYCSVFMERDTNFFIKKYDKFNEYFYWNNRDQPENIDEAQWKERRKVWDNILINGSAPINNGFLYHFDLSQFELYYNLQKYIFGKFGIKD